MFAGRFTPDDAARAVPATRGDPRGPIFGGRRADLRSALGEAAGAVDLALGAGASAAILTLKMS